MSRLLLLEDYTDLADALIELLGKKHEVTHASNVATAKTALNNNSFDLLIFDVSLPDGSGFDLYEHILKTKGRVPVIFLTGQGELGDRMKGLELGAEDYILKPFFSKELLIRVEMRLKQFAEKSDIMTCSDLKFEKSLMQVFLVGNDKSEQGLNLTPNEYKILLLLAGHKGEVVSRTKIVDSVWGPGFSLSDKAVNSHISNLRKKIQSSQCKLVSSEGKGYMLLNSAD